MTAKEVAVNREESGLKRWRLLSVGGVRENSSWSGIEPADPAGNAIGGFTLAKAIGPTAGQSPRAPCKEGSFNRQRWSLRRQTTFLSINHLHCDNPQRRQPKQSSSNQR
jgi:hypothetical protein